jgi:hypothetical protein
MIANQTYLSRISIGNCEKRMTQSELPPDKLTEALDDELPEDFFELEIDEMTEVIDEVNDRFDHRELHFICTGTEIMVIYDRDNDVKMQIEREQ